MSLFSDFDRLRRQMDSMFNVYQQSLFDTPYIHGIDNLGDNNQQPIITNDGSKDQQLAATGNSNNVLSRSNILGNSALSIRCDISETDNSYVVSAELPGVQKQDVKLSIDDNILNISASKQQEYKAEDKEHRYMRIERSYGNVQRSLRLPQNVDVNTVQAKMDNGVLKISVNKKPVPQKKQNIINIE